MARHKAKNGAHAINGRKKRYRINLDGGLHDRLVEMAKQERPHYKDFIAAWKQINKLERKLDEMDATRRSEMLLNFVKVAAALTKKYDHHLQNPERHSDHKQYMKRMSKVFRIIIWDRLQTQSSYSDGRHLDEVIKSTDAITAIAKRHNVQTYDLT